jgi:hypothetical protein
VKDLLHQLWSTDFGLLEAKLRSVVSFGAFVVAGCSAVANAIPKYERVASRRLRVAAAAAHKTVNVLALNFRVRKAQPPQ